MLNSIVANVVPPSIPSARKGISFYGTPEAAKETQPKINSTIPAAPVSTTPVNVGVPADTFTKQPKTQTKV